jgi:hypothetical protein
LDNHGFRYFDPEIGRYISPDPVGFQGGLNWYSYVFNNPINRVDPLGLDPPSLWKSILIVVFDWPDPDDDWPEPVVTRSSARTGATEANVPDSAAALPRGTHSPNQLAQLVAQERKQANDARAQKIIGVGAAKAYLSIAPGAIKGAQGTADSALQSLDGPTAFTAGAAGTAAASGSKSGDTAGPPGSSPEGEDKTLYRGMKDDGGMPKLSPTKNGLGVVTDPTKGDPDIVVDQNGNVQPYGEDGRPQGMSVAPDSWQNLPSFRRPSGPFGGTNDGNTVFQIQQSQVEDNPYLKVYPDGSKHSVVGPAEPDTPAGVFQNAIDNTRSQWQRTPEPQQ